jgi:hypothetical protein
LDSFPENSDEVYVIVDNDERLIFLWKGLSAGVRQKFIGSRATGDKRKELGYHYRIEVMDEEDETSSFIKLIRGDEAPAPKTGFVGEESEEDGQEFTSYAEAAAAQGIDVTAEDIAETAGMRASGAPEHISKMGGVGARPQRSFLADPNFFNDVKEDKKTREKISGVLQETSREEAVDLINALGSPSGFEREMLIVGNTVYRVKSEEGDQISLLPLENPLDGVIMVKQYTPRLLAENGKIKAVELLKQTSDEVEVDESLTQDLEDLTAMFQIEIE